MVYDLYITIYVVHSFTQVVHVAIYMMHLGRAMRKRVFGHMRTAKARISLHMHAV